MKTEHVLALMAVMMRSADKIATSGRPSSPLELHDYIAEARKVFEASEVNVIEYGLPRNKT